jgi:hypothetical protein
VKSCSVRTAILFQMFVVLDIKYQDMFHMNFMLGLFFDSIVMCVERELTHLVYFLVGLLIISYHL